VASLAGGMFAVHLTHETDRKEERIVMLGDDNLYYISGAGTFEDANAFKESEARLATALLINRNPYGLDDPTGIERSFNSSMIKKIHDDLHDREAAFQAQQIHWGFEFSKVEYLYVSKDQYSMSVYGQVLVNQVFEGRSLPGRSEAIKVNYTFTRNHEPAPGWKRHVVVTHYDIFWPDQPQKVAQSR
jgi:hypothetical protein